MNSAEVTYIWAWWEFIDCVLPMIGFPPWAVRFPVVVVMIQPPPDYILVFVPSVVISRVRLVSNLVTDELR